LEERFVFFVNAGVKALSIYRVESVWGVRCVERLAGLHYFVNFFKENAVFSFDLSIALYVEGYLRGVVLFSVVEKRAFETLERIRVV
jgi:hypothetical protein